MADTVIVYRSEVDRLMLSPSGKVYKSFSKYGDKVQRAARRRAPKDSGKGAASIGKNIRVVGRRLIIRVGTNERYMLWQHDGTGIYGPKGTPVRPKKAPFLVFIPKGGTHLIRKRTVKGVKPDPFLYEALRTSVPWPVRRYYRK